MHIRQIKIQTRQLIWSERFLALSEDKDCYRRCDNVIKVQCYKPFTTVTYGYGCNLRLLHSRLHCVLNARLYVYYLFGYERILQPSIIYKTGLSESRYQNV